MRAVLQRVSQASVTADGAPAGTIGPGLVVLLGVESGDTADDADWIARRVAALRLFDDPDGAMSRALADADGALLVVSQFTLLASTRKGTRPSWHRAAPPAEAQPLYELFVDRLRAAAGRPVATGRFGASMQVALVNDGPVTLLLDSRVRE
jgi:D-tyrosyl-tRNA(Tyr) deacylase